MIPAPRLRQLVEDAITRHIDPYLLAVEQRAERAERELFRAMIGGAP